MKAATARNGSTIGTKGSTPLPKAKPSTLNVSHFVARKTELRSSVSPLHLRANRMQGGELQGASSFTGLPPAILYKLL